MQHLRISPLFHDEVGVNPRKYDYSTKDCDNNGIVVFLSKTIDVIIKNCILRGWGGQLFLYTAVSNTYTATQTHTQIHTHTHKHIPSHKHTHTYKHISTQSHTHTHTHTHTETLM